MTYTTPPPLSSRTHLHGEVGVVVVVGQHVPHRLVDHREESTERAQPREVHDVLERDRVLQTLVDESVGAEVRLQDGRAVALHLGHKRRTTGFVHRRDGGIQGCFSMIFRGRIQGYFSDKNTTITARRLPLADS